MQDYRDIEFPKDRRRGVYTRAVIGELDVGQNQIGLLFFAISTASPQVVAIPVT